MKKTKPANKMGKITITLETVPASDMSGPDTKATAYDARGFFVASATRASAGEAVKELKATLAPGRHELMGK